jgi:hypothetical protein
VEGTDGLLPPLPGVRKHCGGSSPMYLKDHPVGATLRIEPIRRAVRENQCTLLGTFLGDVLLPEIAEDRKTLQRLMRQLEVPQSRPKIVVAWVAEKIGRLN